MWFGILGPMRVERDGVDVTPRGRLQRILLSTLLAHANQPVSADALCEMLWGDRVDDRASARLQLVVHRLRASLRSAELITYGPLGYTLVVTEGQLDADRFGELAEMLSADEGMDVVARAREALGLWRGLPFADIDSPALEMRRAWWVERRLAIFGRLFEAELDAGNHGDILAEIDDLARQNPINERLQALLMVALFRNGRRGDALDVYRITRERLVEELGIEPGEELRRIHAGVLAGDVGLGSFAAAPVPAQLPPAMAHLSGRDADLVELDKLVAEEGSSDLGSPVCVVTGTAGVGKTAFATHWARKHRGDFPDGQLFCDLRGFSSDEPVEATEVLAAFIRGLGGDTSSLAPGLDERMAMFRSLMAGPRVLILLDNARTAEQVRPLLPGTSGCLVLITSRESLSGLAIRDGAQSVNLDRLEPDDALELLARHAGDWVRDDPKAAGLLIECCARLPLALRIVAEQLRMRPGRDILALAREIAAERPHLDTFDTGDEPSTDVRLVFSWSYESLPASAQRLFRLLGLLPGRDAELDAIAWMTDAEPREVRRSLDQLVKAHLVDEDLDRRFAQHDLLRAYAHELTVAVDSPDEWSAAVSRLLDYYCHVAAGAARSISTQVQNRLPEIEPATRAHPEFIDSGTAMAWLDAERGNIVAATSVAGVGDKVHLIRLSQLLSNYFIVRGHADASRHVHGLALKAAQDVGNAQGEAQAESALGMLEGTTGELDRSERHFLRASEIYREMGYRLGEGASLNNLGQIAGLRGDKTKAIEIFRESLALNRQDDDRPRIALKLANIAGALIDLNRQGEAFEHLEEALEIAREGGFEMNLCQVLRTLARAHSAVGDIDVARDCVREALVKARSMQARVLEGSVLVVFGLVETRRGDREESLRRYQSALRIARETGERDLAAEALEGLAELHAGSDPELAKSHLEEAIAIASRHGLRGREVRLRDRLAALVTP